MKITGCWYFPIWLLTWLLRGGNSLLKFAIICLHDTLIKDIKNSQETPQSWAFHGILRRLKSMIKVLFVCHGKVSPKWQRTSIYNGFSHLSRWISHTFPTIWSLWHSTDDFPLTSVGGIFNEKLNAVKNDRVQIFAISKKHPDIFHTVVGKISLIILGKLFLDTIQ